LTCFYYRKEEKKGEKDAAKDFKLTIEFVRASDDDVF